ncbi:hypothetical protein ABE23_17815 [Bacillus thuringiensis]|uniref:Uncharacterized protein n=2 Tax=Bacillus thuringiensis TaxID=1428 RepID=A0AAP4Q8A2_BACTU|nr:hypothetical protein CAB88_29425 [Bacillus thuringiensis]OTW40030.1 hypothetical protein BK698_18655 [Bacillus thuringiensis serovar thuringiensis]AST05154.1 hypothetical protein BT10792_32040 [Bacillus thuringiensis]MBG9621494.1 hypothetical protein [Bacillus thuringiensis]MBG9661493.1 hypothetical protein [Bacillus thuringiensis]
MITLAEWNEISQSAFFKLVKYGMNLYETAKKGKGYAVHLKLARKNGIKNVTFYSRVKKG